MSSIVKARSVVVVQGQSNIIRELPKEKPRKEEPKPEPIVLPDFGQDFEEDPQAQIAYLDSRVAELEAELDILRAASSQNDYNKKIEEALADVQAIRNEAEREAAAIIEKAHGECEEISAAAHHQGYDAGFEEGKAEGRKAAAEEAQAGMDEIAYFIEMLNMERMQTCREEEGEILKIAFEVAKKVMRQQIKVEPEAIPRMIEDVVKENETAVKVVLSEYNNTLFTRIDRRTRERIKELLPQVKLIVMPNDGTEEIIQVETENGMIDAAVQGQMERLYEQVADQGYEPPAED